MLTAKVVISGRESSHQTTGKKVRFTVRDTCHFISEEVWRNTVEWARKARLKGQKSSLANTHKAMFGPTNSSHYIVTTWQHITINFRVLQLQFVGGGEGLGMGENVTLIVLNSQQRKP